MKIFVPAMNFTAKPVSPLKLLCVRAVKLVIVTMYMVGHVTCSVQFVLYVNSNTSHCTCIILL